MNKQIVGIDISDGSIEALVLKKPFFGKPKISAYARTALRGAVVKNGVIKNEEKLAEHLKKLLLNAKPKAIKSRQCIISIPESQVFTTIFKFPAGLRKREIYNTIPVKAEEVIPFKASEVYFDFKTLSVEGETQEVFYVAVPMKVVDAYVDVLQSIGLEPVAIDLESISLSRALVGPVKKDAGAKLLIDIGSRSTNLNMFDRNGVRQSLTIRVAGDRFTKAVATSMSLKPKEANTLKTKNGFDPKKDGGKVAMVLQKEFQRIIDEARKFIDFYQTEYSRQVDEVILAGGSALLPQIDQYLANNLGVETNPGNPFVKISDINNYTKLKNKAVIFGNVAGLALRGLQKNPADADINLLPMLTPKFAIAPAKGAKKQWRKVYIRLLILIILGLGLAGVYYSKQQGYDVYDQVFPTPDYTQQQQGGDIDYEALEAMREAMLEPATTTSSTATTTDEIVEDEPVVFVEIRPTSLGYLNVRSGPGTSFEKVAEAIVGEQYLLIEEENDWYHVQLDEEQDGWVISTFAELIEEVSADPEDEGNTEEL